MHKFHKLLAFLRKHTHEIVVDVLILSAFATTGIGLIMLADWLVR